MCANIHIMLTTVPATCKYHVNVFIVAVIIL